MSSLAAAASTAATGGHRVGDFVHVQSGSDKPYIAMINEMANGQALLQWMYRQDDLEASSASDEQPREDEIYYSSHLNWNVLETLMDGVQVTFSVPEQAPLVYTASSTENATEYYCRYEHVFGSGKRVPLPLDKFEELQRDFAARSDRSGEVSRTNSPVLSQTAAVDAKTVEAAKLAVSARATEHEAKNKPAALSSVSSSNDSKDDDNLPPKPPKRPLTLTSTPKTARTTTTTTVTNAAPKQEPIVLLSDSEEDDSSIAKSSTPEILVKCTPKKFMAPLEDDQKYRIGAEHQAELPALQPKSQAPAPNDTTFSFKEREPAPPPERVFRAGEVVAIAVSDPSEALERDKRRLIWCRVIGEDEGWLKCVRFENAHAYPAAEEFLKYPRTMVLDEGKEQRLYDSLGKAFSTSLYFAPSTDFTLPRRSDALQQGSSLAEQRKSIFELRWLTTNAMIEMDTEMFYAPALRGVKPSTCSKCKLPKPGKTCELVYCKRYFESCRTALCENCFEEGKTVGLDRERESEATDFAEASYSHWFCTKCSAMKKPAMQKKLGLTAKELAPRNRQRPPVVVEPKQAAVAVAVKHAAEPKQATVEPKQAVVAAKHAAEPKRVAVEPKQAPAAVKSVAAAIEHKQPAVVAAAAAPAAANAPAAATESRPEPAPRQVLPPPNPKVHHQPQPQKRVCLPGTLADDSANRKKAKPTTTTTTTTTTTSGAEKDFQMPLEYIEEIALQGFYSPAMEILRDVEARTLSTQGGMAQLRQLFLQQLRDCVPM